MFFGYKTQIHKDKYFINLGCSHAASYEMPLNISYPFLLANKLGLGYRDYAYSRTSLEYSEYALSVSNYDKAEFVLWQLTYPWRTHNWDATDRNSARDGTFKKMTLTESFNVFAKILHKYKDKNIYFLFVNQSYIVNYMNKLLKINNKLYPNNFSFIDYGVDKYHGGIKTQIMIANNLYEFISNDQKNKETS